MEIICITYHSTNLYLIKSNTGWIMVDAGWPDTLYELYRLLKEKGIKPGEIKHLIVTHFHPDHGGLTQNLKDSGATLLLHEKQVSKAFELNDFFKKNPKVKFKDLDSNNNIEVSSPESRLLLKKLGIEGEIIPTPGHSDDSVTLILDELCAFTGDLPILSIVEAYNNQEMLDSWKLILASGVKTIYPAHANIYNI